MGYGKNLKAYLQANGRSVAYLAKKTGISPQTIYSIIHRDSMPSAGTSLAISAALGINVCDLINGECIEQGQEILDERVQMRFIRYENRISTLEERVKRLEDIIIHFSETINDTVIWEVTRPC